MGFISFISEWHGEAKKIYESDKAIEFLSGINPKHLHPELYKNNIVFFKEAVQNIVNLDEYGNPDLTVDEITALRLAMLLFVYDRHEEYATARKYADALGRLIRTRGRDISRPLKNPSHSMQMV